MDKVIEMFKLNYTYPDGTRALRGITFNVKRGEKVGIVGPNGAGKSTLLLHLNGIIMNSGVRVLGLELKRENLPMIRSKVGLVFQDPDNQLFMPTVFEDVAYGPLNMGLDKEQVLRKVDEALKQVDMSTFAGRLSHHLSFGEKKRVSIATVLSMDTEILVLDEPTSNLDPKHRRGLIEFLNQQAITMIIASHDREMILETCQRVILLDKGYIAADGPSGEILNNKELLEKHDL